MTLATTSFAAGAIEVTFLQQLGRDPFIASPERTAQIRDVANRIARFISEAKINDRHRNIRLSTS